MEYCNQCRRWRPCCSKCHCCACCCRCTCCSASFTAVKRDRLTDAPLAWASYTLYQNGRPMAAAVSDATGAVRFSCLPSGVYELVETAAPAGYRPDPSQYQVIVDAMCNATIGGVAADGYPLYNMPITLSFQKTDSATGLPLAGGVFTLSNGAAATSDANGSVNFGALAPGVYTMRETTAPTGYESNSHTYQVVVMTDGEITVDGVPASNFTVPNTPTPAPSVSFRKYDAATRQPLAGAVFTLNGRTAASDSGGLVDFGKLAPSTYTMTETTVPAGYEPNTATYTVTVSASGTVTVNGQPLSAFSVDNTPTPTPSPVPVISAVTAGDTTIRGTGISGAAIAVSLPNGDTVRTTVDAGGNWQVAVPVGVTLAVGDTVTATQTVAGSAPSEKASFTIQAAA